MRLLAIVAAICLGCDDAPEGSAVEPGEWLPGGTTTNTFLLGSNAFSTPAQNISAAHEPLFHTGNSFFNQAWVQAPASTASRDGLGPLFNARACSSCHFRDGRGRPADEDAAAAGLLLRLSVPGEGPHGEPMPDPVYGGQLQPFAIADVPPEGELVIEYAAVEGRYADGTPYTLRAPTYRVAALGYGPLDPAVLTSPRVAPSMIGLGLLEAIPAARLTALADPDDADGDGISGRVSRVWDGERGAEALGRFGWKGEQPTVRAQVAAAFLGDMGITSDPRPTQNCSGAQPECQQALDGGGPEIEAHLLDRVVAYSSLLAVPVRRDWDAPEVLHGKALFRASGCADCHVPRHTTGAAAFDELSDQAIWPYTDLLLHDMGPGLSDGRPVFAASGQEWRTPPLWGLGLVPVVNRHDRLLHDGRARGVAEAILWHGGEAEAAAEAFKALDAADRGALVRFVESL